jgi:chorismate dehydratase
MTLRLGVVSFLNARPLVYSLKNDPRFVLSHSVPSACAADLQAGRVDVGLIPSIEYARSSAPYEIVPGMAIATSGEVLTVRLYYRKELSSVRRVALDTSSRTSVALLRILLHERYQLAPTWVEVKPDLAAMLEVADAALLIGDPVFNELDSAVPSIDLGREWVEHTGLPFVFAFWAGRVGALDKEALTGLEQAKRDGLAHIDEIASTYADAHGGEVALYARYLRDNIRFDLGQGEVEGLRLFYAKAKALDLIESAPVLSFCR